MKSMYFILWLILLVRIEPIGAQPTDASTLAQLNKFRNDYVQALTNATPALIQPYYAEGIRLMPEFQKTMLGKDNVAAYHKAFANRFAVTEMTHHEIEVLNLGNQVVETGTFVMKVKLKSNGGVHELMGNYLNLWQRRSNDVPLLLTAAWNYHAYYGEMHDLLRFAEVPAIHVASLPNVEVNSPIRFELTAYNRLLDATVTQHDASVWSQYYAPDAVLMPNYRAPCRGKKEIDEYIQTHVKELPVFQELEIRSDRIDESGSFVIEYGSHIASWKNGNSSGVSLGKNIRIWRREPDHSLKLFRSIAMYD